MKAIGFTRRRRNQFSGTSSCAVCVQRPSDGLAKDTFPLLTGNQTLPVHVSSFFFPFICPWIQPETVLISCLPPPPIFFLKKLFKNIDFGISSLESSSSSCRLLITKHLVRLPCIFLISTAWKIPPFLKLLQHHQSNSKAKGKGSFQLALSHTYRKQLLPSRQFKLASKSKEIKAIASCVCSSVCLSTSLTPNLKPYWQFSIKFDRSLKNQ